MKQPSTSGMAGEIPAIRVLWPAIFYGSSFRGDATGSGLLAGPMTGSASNPNAQARIVEYRDSGLVLCAIPE
jgi:hypothetical protein